MSDTAVQINPSAPHALQKAAIDCANRIRQKRTEEKKETILKIQKENHHRQSSKLVIAYLILRKGRGLHTLYIIFCTDKLFLSLIFFYRSFGADEFLNNAAKFAN